MQKYDLTLKDIFKDAEEGLIQLITNTKVKFIRYLDVNFQTIESKESDLIFESILEDTEVILHVEFQSDNDKVMVYRMLRYLTEIYNQYRKPIYQVLIYAGKAKLNMEDKLYFKLAEQSFIDYRYKIIDLDTIEAEDILKLNIVELLPILPLTKIKKDKEKHLTNLINAIIKHTQDIDINTKRNILLKTEILSGIKFDKYVIMKIFMEVKDMFSLKQSSGYQAILEEGVQEGIEKGKQLGLQEGEQLGLEKGKKLGLQEGELIGIKKGQIIAHLEHRFGAIPVKIVTALKKLKSVEELDIALTNVLNIKSVEEFLKSLK